MAQWLEIGIAQVNEIPTFVSRVLPHIRKKRKPCRYTVSFSSTLTCSLVCSFVILRLYSSILNS